MASKLVPLYFKHDYSASDDPKLLRIKRKFGFEGIGIYWCLVEVLYKNKGKITLEELEDFCYDKNCEINKVKVICDIAFEKDKTDNTITNKRITQALIEQEETSYKRSKSAQKRWNKVREVPLPDWMDENGNVKEHKSKPMTEEEKERCQKAMKDLFGDD